MNIDDSSLVIRSIRTRIFRANEAIIPFLIENLDVARMQEGVIVAITSKLISIAESGFAPKMANTMKSDIATQSAAVTKSVTQLPDEKTKNAEQTASAEKAEKKSLVEKEADVFLGETLHSVHMTIKHGLFIPSAGIDESNSETGEFILYPTDPYASAHRIGLALRQHFKLSKLGIILTDSHSTPLRSGVTGIALAHFGFQATRNLVGQKDLFGRGLKATHVNTLDALAVAAVFEMGESNESRPLAIISGARNIEFTDRSSPAEIQIPLENDLYFHLLKK
jgi:F420-0:gamma-glutamyl ligase